MDNTQRRHANNVNNAVIRFLRYSQRLEIIGIRHGSEKDCRYKHKKQGKQEEKFIFMYMILMQM